jgi:phage/plasmid primase-like uncharacterized protein
MIPAGDIELAHTVRIEDEVARRGLRLVGRHERKGSCPICGGTDRFAINTKKQVWNCRGCVKGGDVIALVQHLDGYSFADAIMKLIGDAPRSLIRPAPSSSDHSNGDNAAWLWSQRQPIKDTPVAKYLRKRGYSGRVPATLAYLPERGEHPPAMIAAFGLAREIAPGVIAPARSITGVHLTKLTPDGDKATVYPVKITIGSSMGQPIVIASPNDLLGMAIAEGIEDGLTIYRATGLGVWVAGTAGRMPALANAVPNYIECVTICQHADDAGRRNATELADLLRLRGMEVFFEGDRL